MLGKHKLSLCHLVSAFDYLEMLHVRAATGWQQSWGVDRASLWFGALPMEWVESEVGNQGGKKKTFPALGKYSGSFCYRD